MPDGFKIEIAWDRSTWVDETAYVRPVRAAVTAAYGRDQATALAPTVTGRGSLLLDNSSRRFSPRNTSSPLFGTLKPARPVRITRTVGATTYTLIRGHTDDQPISPDLDDRSVALTLVDSLADFRSHNVTCAMRRGIRTGEAIGFILDAAGWPTDLRDLDPGATYIGWWWEDNTDAMAALEKVVRSEGPPALLTVGTNGEIVFRDRHHRLTRANSLTSQQTWRATGLGLVMNRPFVYEEPWNNIVNSAVADVDVRVPGALQQVWTSEAIIDLTAGEQRVITVTVTDPFYGAVAPVLGVDYTALTGSVTTAVLNGSGGSTAIVLTAIGGNARITNLQLRAFPVPVGHTVQESNENPDSKEEYGTRSYPGDLPWCNPYDAEAVLSTAVAMRAEPLPVLQVKFLIGNDPAKASLLGLDLGDRVTVIEPETATDGDFYIESIEHGLTGPHDHAITFGLEACHDIVTNVFRFDVAGQGFNDGVFGSGLDDPATLFRFDGGVGHRFNEGVFAT